ncbi:MAG: RNA methyltransferase [Acidithiobacillus sp.]|uniref:RNA methyltransferase n=1 Tax=Acidithiobacillus sp. TaxID=1872118 RepID=UPI003D083D23
MTEYKEEAALLHEKTFVAPDLRIVLVETSHPGNIGSAARAMKVMGLERLILVRPQRFPDAQATALASGAEDLLERAEIHDDLSTAVADCQRVYGTTARDRHIAWPQLEARPAAAQIVALGAHAPVAILFGNERAGLSNDELDLCQCLIQIPTAEVYRSLNLAQAVQILAYELLLAQRAAVFPSSPGVSEAAAPRAAMEGFYGHLRRVLRQAGFLQAPREAHMMRRLRRLFDRAQPDLNEVYILRGILTEVERWAGQVDKQDEHRL